MVKTRNKRLKWKLLSGLLMAMLVFTNILPLNALAADNTEGQVSELPVLTGLNITYLDEPVAGKVLDTKAVVVTDQNVIWQIPVIWTDLKGNIVYVAEPGQQYLPVFIFYMPKGYTIEPTGADGSFWVKLPFYLTNLYGTEGMVFVSDPALGITYITYGLQYDSTSTQELVTQAWNAETERHAAEAAKEGSNTVANTSETSSSHHHHSSSSNNDVNNEGPLPGGGDDPVIPAEDEIPEQILIHCTDKLIETVDIDTLEWLVDLIKNKLEPQAINLLMDGFDAFKNAAEDELSDEIGLLIYLGDDTMKDGSPAPGFACGFYMSENCYDNEGLYEKNVFAINAAMLLQYDEQRDGWIVLDTDETKALLDNTIVHELMHGFMYDYTRTIMTEDYHNAWFIEGMASCVDNSYQYRNIEFMELMENGQFTGQSIINGFTIDENSHLFQLTPEWGGYADYTTGYLATAYLGYLEYNSSHDDSAIDENGNVDTDKIRSGLNSVLVKLHENETLDDIITNASGFRYADTIDFYTSFVWNYYDEDASDEERIDEYSLAFCVDFLNYMENNSTAELPAHGSLLISDQHYFSPLDWDSDDDAEADKYRIANSGDLVRSSVDPNKTWNTGGISEQGDYPDLEYDDEGDNQLAAKTVCTDDENPEILDSDNLQADDNENEAIDNSYSNSADNDLVTDHELEITDNDVANDHEPKLTDNDASDNNEPSLTENEDADTGGNEISSAETASSDDTDTAEESDTGAENRSEDNENDNGSSSTEDTSSDSEPSEDASM